MYKFTDNKTEKICKKYRLTECLILFEFDDIKHLKEGLSKLAKHTSKILDEMNEVDDFGTLLLTESIRFLIHAFRFQKHYDNNYEKYYIDILDKFHDLGYLLFKKDIRPYKLYKNKKFAFRINYRLHNETIPLIYYSLKNMRIDYGRYRTDKITQLYPKQSSLDYNFINNIS
mgnify:CR=1 FL=1|tara:strand:- start:3308 stop:3823 length:516 start_codon:yes stop_codon:yes gene_type:complete